MNKARVFLTAIGVLAVVGGALAFKANTYLERNVFCSTSGPQTCVLTQYKTQVDVLGETTQPCPGTTIYFTESLCTAPTTGTVYVPRNI